MLNRLFSPELKVQKQRSIMRDTDARVAKYSRRGILSTFLAFTICMLVGEYSTLKPIMAIVLIAGLLFFSVVRSYYLFRFDTIYARGPAKWRNTYFFISLAGASWWSFIMTNVTLTLGLSYEAPLLWIYTVVFFSSVAYVFAPYQRFLTLYLFIGLVPLVIAAITLREPLSSLFALVMLILFLMLDNQGRVICKQYWDRLQANYDLSKRASALEAERIDTQSSIATNQAFLSTLSNELRVSFDDVLGTLSLLEYSSLTNDQQRLIALCYQHTQRQSAMITNVIEYSHITDKKLVFDHSIVNPRVQVELILKSISDSAHRQGIELFSVFAPELPVRIRCDASRFDQVINNLIISSFDFCERGELFVRSNYTYLNDKQGRVRIEVVNVNPKNDTQADLDNPFDPYNSTDIHFGLNLSIAKGIAEGMGGSVGVEKTETTGLRFWMTAVVETVAKNSVDIQEIPKLTGKRVLLYQPPTKIVSTFMQTLSNWGLEVETVNESERGTARLISANGSKAFDIIFIYTSLDDLGAIGFAEKVANTAELSTIPRVIVISAIQMQANVVKQHLETSPSTQVLYKPIEHKKVLKILKAQLIPANHKEEQSTEESVWLAGRSILLFQKEEIETAVAEGILLQLGCKVTNVKDMSEALHFAKDEPFDAFITESHLNNVDIKSTLQSIRECQKILTGKHIPILALSNKIQGNDASFCLSCGMDGFIDKPLQLEDFQSVLRRWIGRREQFDNSVDTDSQTVDLSKPDEKIS